MVQAIEIVRGTTLPMILEITDANGSLYSLGTGERVLFGVKKEPKDESPIFVLTAAAQGATGQYSITIYPENTQALEPGRYWYDVGLESGGDYFNIIEPSGFTILPNITSKGAGGA